MRAIWKGSLVFGKIAIPVGLAPTFVDGDLHLRGLCREHEQPLTQPRWCEQHERALEPEEIVRGFKVAEGQYVLIEDAELEAIAPDAEARAIEIFGFLDAGQLDPLLLDRSYYLTPSEQALMRPAYGLLSFAMRETRTIALARFVAWRAEHVCAIGRRGGSSTDMTLVLHVLHAAEDLVAWQELADQLADTEPTAEQNKLAKQLIGQLRRPLEELDLVDDNRERLRALVDDKLAGREIVRTDRREQAAAPIASADLGTALRESIKATRPAKRAQRSSSGARSRSRSSARS